MGRLQAVFWDVDGTLAESERDGHRVAFNQAFEAGGLSWRWDEAHYGVLLRVTGGRERLLHDMAQRSDAPVLAGQREALARSLHRSKNERYAELVRQGRVGLREGVLDLLRECRARSIRIAIVTTTSRTNVEALLRTHLGQDWQDGFAAVVCGEDVQRKKPDPEAYRLALRRLGVDPLDVVAIEDSPGGVASARAAGVPVIVTQSRYFADAAFDGAHAIGPGLHSRTGWRPSLPKRADGATTVGVDDLADWLAQGDSVSHVG